MTCSLMVLGIGRNISTYRSPVQFQEAMSFPSDFLTIRTRRWTRRRPAEVPDVMIPISAAETSNPSTKDPFLITLARLIESDSECVEKDPQPCPSLKIGKHG